MKVRSGAVGVALLLLSAGGVCAATGVPYLNSAWVEAAEDGGYLYHCRIRVSAVTAPELDLAVQFRLADGTNVAAKGKTSALVLWPERWRRDGTAGGAVWHPAPVALSAGFFVERAELGVGTHAVDVIYDVYDPQAKRYVESGHYVRATFRLEIGEDGRSSLAVVEPDLAPEGRDTKAEPMPPIVWRRAKDLAEEPVPARLASYGLVPARVLGTLRFRPGRSASWAGFAAGGGSFLCGTRSGSFQVFDAGSGETTRSLSGSRVHAPDGSFLVLSGRDLVEPETGQRRATLSEEPGEVLAARLFGDPVQLAVLGPAEAAVWDLGSGARVRRKPLERSTPSGEPYEPRVRRATITPDGRHGGLSLEAGKRQMLDLFDLGTGKRVLRTHAVYGAPPLFAVTSDAKSVAAPVYDFGPENGVAIFDLATGEKRHVLPETRDARALALSPDGALLAVPQGSGVTLADPGTGSPIRTLALEGRVEQLAFTPDGRVLVADAEGGVTAWEVATGQVLSRTAFRGETALGPDGRHAVTLTREPTIVAWDLRTGAVPGDAPTFDEMAFSDDGTRVAAVDARGRVRVWDTASGRCALELSAPLGPFALSPDGRRLAAGRSGEAPLLWDVDEAAVILAPRDGGPGGYGPAFSRDGRFAAVAWADGRVRVYDLATQALVRSAALPGTASSLTFSGDGRRLHAVADYGVVEADLTTDTPFRRVLRSESARWLAFSPDGSRVVCGETTPTIFDARTGEVLMRLDATDLYEVRFLFSPDGRRVLLIPSAEEVLAFDAADGRLLKTLGGELRLHAAAFSADGKLLLTACERSAVVAWRWETPEVGD